MDVALLKSYAEKGMTRKQIADAIGLPLSTVSNNCTKHGIKTKRPDTSGTRPLCERTQRIIELRRQGQPIRSIAKTVGCDKSYISKVCRSAKMGGAVIEQRLTESQVADYVSRSGFTYVGGYSSGKNPITVRCNNCGRTFERQFHVFRDVANGTWKCNNECPLCRQDRQNKIKQEQEAEREERRIKAEREAQEVAKRKAERLSRKIGNETTKRLATHVCKNCGVEFCQMVTGYNSEVYCSERCQVRWLNRTRSEKRYKTLMSRRHDNSISLERLYKRDNGICYLCGKQCDWEDGVTKEGTFIAGNNYPSIDHVVPVARGGTHTWDNIKLAHRLCNTLKRDS